MAAGLGEVLRLPWSRVVLLAVAVEGMFLLGPMAFIPTYLHHRHGISLAAAGAVAAVYAVGGLAYALSARRIVARLGERRMVLWGGILMGVGFLSWWLLPGWGAAGAASLVVGFGTYLFHNTLQTHATQMAPAVRGTAVALFAFCLFFGQAIGVSLAGWAVDRFGFAPMLVASAIALPLAGAAFARRCSGGVRRLVARSAPQLSYEPDCASARASALCRSSSGSSSSVASRPCSTTTRPLTTV
jgi:MFS family permease